LQDEQVTQKCQITRAGEHLSISIRNRDGSGRNQFQHRFLRIQLQSHPQHPHIHRFTEGHDFSRAEKQVRWSWASALDMRSFARHQRATQRPRVPPSAYFKKKCHFGRSVPAPRGHAAEKPAVRICQELDLPIEFASEPAVALDLPEAAAGFSPRTSSKKKNGLQPLKKTSRLQPLTQRRNLHLLFLFRSQPMRRSTEGHDFSRAEQPPFSHRALAPEVCFLREPGSGRNLHPV